MNCIYVLNRAYVWLRVIMSLKSGRKYLLNANIESSFLNVIDITFELCMHASLAVVILETDYPSGRTWASLFRL